MGQPIQYQQNFTGMVQDVPIDQLPEGAVWDMSDFFPDVLGAPLRRRGAYAYSSSTAMGSSTSGQAVMYAPFSAGSYLLAIGGDNTLYRWSDGGATTSVGSVFAVDQDPVFHRNLVIIPAGDGTTAPKSYDRTTLGNLAGTPPAGQFAVVYKDRTLLANSAANPTRVWFSPAGNPAGTWDTTNSWIDTSGPVVGMAALRNAVLVFHNDHSGVGTERLRGSIPPPNTDMVLEPMFEQGCADARSIAMWGDKAIWADLRGVYVSDGASLLDLTHACGVKNKFITQFGGVTDFVMSGAVYRDYYILSIHSVSNTANKLNWMFDLNRRTCWKISNLCATSFANVYHSSPSVATSSTDLVAVQATDGKLITLSPIFSPASTRGLDAGQTTWNSYIMTRYYRGFVRLHRRWVPALGPTTWRGIYLDYKFLDWSGGSVAPSPGPGTILLSRSHTSGSYWTLAGQTCGTLKYTDAHTTSDNEPVVRHRVPDGTWSLRSGFSSPGFQLGISIISTAQADISLFGISAEGTPREQSRIA